MTRILCQLNSKLKLDQMLWQLSRKLNIECEREREERKYNKSLIDTNRSFQISHLISIEN